VQHRARHPVGLAAQAQGRSGAAAAQVQVAVLEPDLLTDLAVAVDRERQRRRLRQHGERGDGDLDGAGGQLGVVVAVRAQHDLAGDLHAELGAQAVGPLGHLALAEHDLGRSGGVAEVDEDHAAVITAAGHPPGEGHGLSGVLGTQAAGGVGTHHGARLSGHPRHPATRFAAPPTATGPALGT
jgi:hypothetical protein